MALEADHEGIRHHYMHGLRFDSMWDYLAYSRKGHRRWARLDLGAVASKRAMEDDPEGLWWCMGRRACVLGQRPVPLTGIRATAATPRDPEDGMAALRQLLPNHEIEIRQLIDAAICQDVVNLITTGGGVLARLERKHPIKSIPPCWVWVVGVETKPLRDGLSSEKIPVLLLVGQELRPPWTSGYGAKATFTDVGAWMIRSVDGHAWVGTFSSMIFVCPK